MRDADAEADADDLGRGPKKKRSLVDQTALNPSKEISSGLGREDCDVLKPRRGHFK
jgi:hypothetical protein